MIGSSQIKVWTANPQQFVEDEDDDTFSYTVRISAQDLLLVRRAPCGDPTHILQTSPSQTTAPHGAELFEDDIFGFKKKANMFHPRSVIAHNIYMLQAGQNFDLPEDLQSRRKQTFKFVIMGVLHLCCC